MVLIHPYALDTNYAQKRAEQKKEISQLTSTQKIILFSIENELVKMDIKSSAKQLFPLQRKQAELKQEWLEKWKRYTITNLQNEGPDQTSNYPYIYNYQGILAALQSESQKQIDFSWLFIIVREATLFVPYTWLDTEANLHKQKQYLKLSYTCQYKFLKELLRNSNTISPEYVDYYVKEYKLPLFSTLA